MKITYDPNGDMMYIEFNENYPFNTDAETVPGLAIIYDEAGKICAIEIEDAMQFVTQPNRVDFECFTYPDTEQDEPEAAVEGHHAELD